MSWANGAAIGAALNLKYELGGTIREFGTFIGGVAVGILAVTGVFVMEEDNTPTVADQSNDELTKVEEEIKGNETSIANAKPN